MKINGRNSQDDVRGSNPSKRLRSVYIDWYTRQAVYENIEAASSQIMICYLRFCWRST